MYLARTSGVRLSQNSLSRCRRSCPNRFAGGGGGGSSVLSVPLRVAGMGLLFFQSSVLVVLGFSYLLPNHTHWARDC